MPATITLTFANTLNTSVQIGDTAYYLDSQIASGGFNTGLHTDIVEIGIITAINQGTNTITVGNAIIGSVSGTPFILFSKDNKANLSSILGYYAEVKFKNTSTTTSELFSVGVDTFESSK